MSRDDEESRRALGAQIRVFREENGISTAELAEIIGRDVSIVRKIEKGSVTPSVDALMALRRELGLSLDWLADQVWPAPDFIDDRHEGQGRDLYYFTRMPRDPGRPFECTLFAVGEDTPRPIPASHAGAEFIQLLSGEVFVTLGTRVVHVWRTSSVLRIPPWVEHTVVSATSDDARVRWTMSEQGEVLHTAPPRKPTQSEFVRRILERSRTQAPHSSEDGAASTT